MFRQIVFSAVLSGLVAGAIITAVQLFTMIPMILEAESYEAASASSGHGHHHGHSHGHYHGEGAGHAGEWTPADGTERNLYTMLTNSLAAIGFGLLLSACYAMRGSVNWRSGMLWGLAGFATFQLAPALGLPPELPGSAAAELTARQAWWVSTALATAAGLGLLVFARQTAIKLIGPVLIVLPHLLGAPQPEVHASAVPETLLADFMIRTLLVGGLFWVMLGALSGYSFNRLSAK